LTLVSGVNIAVWFVLYRRLDEQPTGSHGSMSGMGLMLLLCAGYVFGCAFRSILPRADVQRICLFDTWLSSVVVGRSVDGVIGRPSLWIVKRFGVLRFRLMGKRGPWLRPQASEGEAQHGPFCWIGRIGQGD
jgi:hypothetical protein